MTIFLYGKQWEYVRRVNLCALEVYVGIVRCETIINWIAKRIESSSYIVHATYNMHGISYWNSHRENSFINEIQVLKFEIRYVYKLFRVKTYKQIFRFHSSHHQLNKNQQKHAYTANWMHFVYKSRIQYNFIVFISYTSAVHTLNVHIEMNKHTGIVYSPVCTGPFWNINF